MAEPRVDQSRAREGFVLHHVSLARPLPKGEHERAQHMGKYRNEYYVFDFGVD